MNTLILTIKDLTIFKEIKKQIETEQPLTPEQKLELCFFLGQLPLLKDILSEKVITIDPIEIKLFDFNQMLPTLKNWVSIFKNLPGKNTSAIITELDSEILQKQGVILLCKFPPSIFYDAKDKTIDVYLKTDGSALFKIETLEDFENFPDLYSFKGTWKESYKLAVRTALRGWPQDKFPIEFEKYIRKEIYSN